MCRNVWPDPAERGTPGSYIGGHRRHYGTTEVHSFPCISSRSARRVASARLVLTEQNGVSDNVSEYVARQRPSRTSEDLGAQIIRGIASKGERITWREPAASSKTSQPKFSEIDEIWKSVDSEVPVLSKTIEQDGTQIITRLISFTATEPDPELFRVPPQYTIQ